MKFRENFQILLDRPFAHRGLHSGNDLIPENSMIAFQKAVTSDIAIELDVHLLSDNNVVVFHDETLERMCGIKKNIEEFDCNEIKKLRLLKSNNKIPLLVEVLEAVDGKVPLLIELKNKKKIGVLEQAVVREINGYNGEIAIQSFNPFTVSWFAKNAPHILRGQLSSSFQGEKINFVTKVLLRNMFLNFLSKPNFIAYDSSDMPNKKVRRLRKNGLPILCWTIKSENEYNRVKAFCDNVIFEGFIPD